MSLFDLIPGVSAIKAVLNPIEAITTGIVKWQEKKIDAKTEQERIQADENIKSLQSRRDVLISEAGGGSRINSFMRAAIAAPVAFILWKIFVWDKALGQWTAGHTDSLSPELWQVITAVIGFYFLYEGAIGVTRIIKR